MVVNELEPSRRHLPLVQQKYGDQAKPVGDANFAETVKGFIDDVNNLQVESKDQIEKLIKGEPVDIHDVMISAQKAKTSFQLLMELRNKGLDLYREVMRMQV